MQWLNFIRAFFLYLMNAFLRLILQHNIYLFKGAIMCLTYICVNINICICVCVCVCVCVFVCVFSHKYALPVVYYSKKNSMH